MSIYCIHYRYCIKGHLNGSVETPISSRFCQRCGKAFLTHCKKCGTELQSIFESPLFHGTARPVYTPNRPGACAECGKRFPWTSWWAHQEGETSRAKKIGIGIVSATLIAAVIAGISTFFAPLSPMMVTWLYLPVKAHPDIEIKSEEGAQPVINPPQKVTTPEILRPTSTPNPPTKARKS